MLSGVAYLLAMCKKPVGLSIPFCGILLILYAIEWLLFILLRASVALFPVRSPARILSETIGVAPFQVPMPTTWASTLRACIRRAALFAPPVSPSVASSIYSKFSDRNCVSYGFRKCIKVNPVTRWQCNLP
jgi:hypothetical protein